MWVVVYICFVLVVLFVVLLLLCLYVCATMHLTLDLHPGGRFATLRMTRLPYGSCEVLQETAKCSTGAGTFSYNEAVRMPSGSDFPRLSQRRLVALSLTIGF